MKVAGPDLFQYCINAFFLSKYMYRSETHDGQWKCPALGMGPNDTLACIIVHTHPTCLEDMTEIMFY